MNIKRERECERKRCISDYKRAKKAVLKTQKRWLEAMHVSNLNKTTSLEHSDYHLSCLKDETWAHNQYLDACRYSEYTSKQYSKRIQVEVEIEPGADFEKEQQRLYKTLIDNGFQK